MDGIFTSARPSPRRSTTGPAQSVATRLEWWKEQIEARYLAERIRPAISPSAATSWRRRPAATANTCQARRSAVTLRPSAQPTNTRSGVALGQNPHPSAMWHGAASLPAGRFLDDDERKRLMAGGETHDNPDIYPAVLLAITTGMRQGRNSVVALAASTIKALPGATRGHEERRGAHCARAEDCGRPVNRRGKVRSLTDDRLFTDPRDFDRCWRETLATAGSPISGSMTCVILPRPISPCTARRWLSWPKSSGTRRCRWWRR